MLKQVFSQIMSIATVFVLSYLGLHYYVGEVIEKADAATLYVAPVKPIPERKSPVGLSHSKVLVDADYTAETLEALSVDVNELEKALKTSQVNQPLVYTWFINRSKRLKRELDKLKRIIDAQEARSASSPYLENKAHKLYLAIVTELSSLHAKLH